MNASASNPPRRRGVLQLLAGGSLVLGGGLLWQDPARSAEAAARIPPPAQDLPPAGGLQKAVFAGGCFWGVQGVYQHVKGVRNALSGYAGGTAPTAAYELVSRGNTGHAESVEVTYDPAQVSYGTLLQIFFAVAHDPTQLNRQGPDVGTQYRSAIFPASPAQRAVAQAYIAQLDAAHVYGKPIVTRLEDSRGFFAAEAYHQDYLTENPQQPYIAYNDLPKIEHLKQLFPERYQADPVLVKRSK
ncbi:peptide-methionine (S)-S-oxide reductase MsrA [Ramlibacter sp. G-1-2-2]|uniref:Peptide methionine sulfoxide reductase MsrA n=1 Tax=Ramlibacter agri TaxID=2728837 RepID=A0A848H3X3_9BURK|nr:peptide-methionine (S)-S-oxide reductase MsrA [Ramlibacter agri]NML44251.1 peptide-methionine (S)-S-oxide reductase MsrA [Ramlibacter agri]